MACSSSCPTQDHESWGACVRAKGIKTQVDVPGTGYSASASKAWDNRLDSYRDARAHGIQPASSKTRDIQTAVRESDRTGTAFTAQ